MKSIKKGRTFAFGIRDNGFIFPMFKRIRLDTFEDDFGVSGYFHEDNSNMDYIIINE